MYRNILFILIALSLFACEKSETIVIPDNTAPPDETVETFIMENYVHKVYIALLGRDAEDTELDAALNTLTTANFSLQSRETVLQSIMDADEYSEKLFDITRIEILNNLDTSDVTSFISIYEASLADPNQSGAWPYIQYEVARLYDFRDALPNLITDQLDMRDVYKRSVNNIFYDEINMGTENFVVAVFQNLLNRYPTDSELKNSKLMVAGQSGSIFLQTGNSKNDFVNIFFDADNYYEGRVKYLFTKYLFREPNTEEMFFFTKSYKESGSFKALHRSIFAMDEYAGL